MPSRVEQLKEILAHDANNLLTRYALAMEYSNPAMSMRRSPSSSG